MLSNKWEVIDCRCYRGLRWHTEEPKECPDCDGTGNIYRHIKSGVLAAYPGGPFLGRETRNEVIAKCDYLTEERK